MFCIPTMSWTRQTGQAFLFRDFRTELSSDLRAALTADLNNIAENSSSENLLRLVQSSALSQCKHEYSISIEAHIVELTANSLQGFHFGLTTLKLLLASGKNLLNCGFAQETPDFAHRGVMLDVSRGKMASLDYLKNLVGLMSDLKYNILQLYCEDKLALTEHPSVGRITGAYTQQQIVELDAYCRERFVELQPCIQTYSHVHGVLQLPGYSHLAENDGLFSFAAGNEGVYAFLEDELRETLPWFSSKTLNINMDEAYDIGTGFSSEEVRKKGKGAVFITHIKRVVELARRYGAKDIILWGDVMNKYPELLAELPERTIIADWNYNPQETYPSLKSYEGKCVDFWAAGGVSTWNSIFPRMYNTYCNLIGLAAEAKESGATGFLVTDWGDYGHLQPLGLSLYGYLVGAQQAFCAKRIAPEVIEEAAWPMIFCDVRVKQAFQNLMDSNLAPNLQTGFKTMSIYYFFDDMLDGFSMHGSEHYPKLGEEVFPILQEKGSQAFDLLEEVLADGVCETHRFPDENWKALFGTAFLRELRLSARMTRFAGRKGELSTQIRATLANPHARPDDILAHILAIKLLYREFLAIRRDFEDVWMLRAYPQGIEGCLTLFDKAGIQLAETSKWLATQYRQCACGKALDCTLQTYTAAQNYKILWTADFKNMWDRAYPWQ